MPQKDPERLSGCRQDNYQERTSQRIVDNKKIPCRGNKIPGTPGTAPVSAALNGGISCVNADSILILLNTPSGCLYRTLNGGPFFYHRKEKGSENQNGI